MLGNLFPGGVNEEVPCSCIGSIRRALSGLAVLGGDLGLCCSCGLARSTRDPRDGARGCPCVGNAPALLPGTAVPSRHR